MDDLNNDYINVKQYVEYLNKNLISMTFNGANEKLKKGLKNNTFGSNVIERNNIIYIKKDYFDDSVELYRNSIELSNIPEKIVEYLGKEVNSSKNICKILASRCNAYCIRLIHNRNLYISKEKFGEILKSLQIIKNKKCITSSEFLNMINNSFRGVKFKALLQICILNFIKENKLEVISETFIGNVYPHCEILYPHNTVEKAMQSFNEYVKENVKLLNITFDEYLALNDIDFERDYRVLKKEDFLILKESSSYFNRFKKLTSIFEKTDIKLILVCKQKIYVSKKEFNEYVNFKKIYVAASSYFKDLGIKFSKKVARNNGIEIVTNNKFCYIKKEDIDRYIHVTNYNSESKKSNSLYDRVRIKIEYYPNENDNKYPKFKEYLMEFVKRLSGEVRGFTYVHRIYNLYNVILDNIKIDLETKNEEENNLLFNKIIRRNYESQNSRIMTIQFVNYLIDKKNFKLNRIIDVKEKRIKEAYTKEQFITLLSKLLEIINNKNNLKRIYKNWNLSSAVSYVFMHYCLAWRKMDLVCQLPKPNFNLISADITDGESFIRWLENGNKITYEMAEIICRSLEEETKRLRKKAYKNGVKLSCIISDALMKEVATLLCLNEANRQIHIKLTRKKRIENRCFNAGYIEPKNIQILFKENFDIDIEEILGGNFSNIRMNKGFLTLVEEKAEELNLFAYHYAEVLRGHSPTRGALAETTKIYLDKDVAKASVMAFATGTMGSVAYTLLQLVDEGFEDKSAQEQIKAIQNLNMTPYTIEKNVKVISNKISAIKSEIYRFFKQGGYKKGFLQELIYGQKSYGIEKKTKCLIKITKKEELGISRISSMNYSVEKATNKWCPFNRRSCIGCQYMIALRYFVYEFEKKFNKVLDDFESAESQLDKEIAVESINELYIPVLNDLWIILGSDEISKVINTERYKKLVETF